MKKIHQKRKSFGIRKKINPSGRFRLSVFRSNKHLYAQVIDDKEKKTLLSASDLSEGISGSLKGLKKMEIAEKVGEHLAKEAVSKKITQVVFDRGDFRYHGRVKALADGARKGGLNF